MTAWKCPLLLLVLTSACGRPAGNTLLTSRDSTGVRVVTYTEEPWANPEQLRLSRVFRVGWRDEEPTFQGEPWPAPGWVRPDGSSVVGDYHGRQVYLLSPDGASVDSLGSAGEGPGQYREVNAIVVAGDTILVQDEANRRITSFANGQSTSFPLPPGHCELLTAVNRDTYLATPYCQPGTVGPGWYVAPVEGWARHQRAVDTLMLLPISYTNSPGDHNPTPRFASFAGLQNGGFVHVRSDVPAVTWYDAAGRVRQILRWPAKYDAVTDEDWDRYEQWYVSRDYREQSPAVTARLLLETKADFAGAMSLFGPVYASDDGSVWLSAFTWEGMPGYADVVSPAGVYLGRVRLPRRFAPIDVNGEYVLGWEFDEWDVPAISLYRVAGLPGGHDRKAAVE